MCQLKKKELKNHQKGTQNTSKRNSFVSICLGEIKKLLFASVDRFRDRLVSFCGKASDLFGIAARREVSNPIDMAVVNFPPSSLYPVPITRNTGRITLKKTSMLHPEDPKSRTIPSKAGSTFFGVSFISVS